MHLIIHYEELWNLENFVAPEPSRPLLSKKREAEPLIISKIFIETSRGERACWLPNLPCKNQNRAKYKNKTHSRCNLHFHTLQKSVRQEEWSGRTKADQSYWSEKRRGKGERREHTYLFQVALGTYSSFENSSEKRPMLWKENTIMRREVKKGG